MNRRVSNGSKLRFAAFAGVLLIVSGLIVNLFDEARAATFEFDSPATSVSGSSTFTVNLQLPTGERTPISSVDAVIEQQDSARSGQTGLKGKAGAALVTRAECARTEWTSDSSCTSSTTPALITSGSKAGGITNVRLVSFTTIDNGYTVANPYGPGTLTFDQTGYGYDESSPIATPGFGYGYGFRDGVTGNVNAGAGNGYGYNDEGGLNVQFQVTVSGSALGNGHYYLTVLIDTGSQVLGDISTPFHEFDVSAGGGSGSGGGGADGGGTTGGITLDAVSVSPPAGAISAWRVTGVTQVAGQTVTINTGSDFVPSIVFTPSSDLNGATIDVVHYGPDNPPPGVGNLPPGLEVVGFVQITVSSGGTTHTITMAITIPPGQAEGKNPDKAVFIKWSEGDGRWISKGRITLTQNADGSLSGEGTSDCCSDYAVAFDEQDPEVTLTVPDGTLTDTVEISAEASDNLEVAKVEFYVGDTLVNTDESAPYSYQLNTALYPNGDQTIRAVAYDVVDNMAESTAPSSFDNEDAPGGPGDGGPGDGGDGGLPWGTILIILIVIAIIGFAGYYFYQQSQKK